VAEIEVGGRGLAQQRTGEQGKSGGLHGACPGGIRGLSHLNYGTVKSACPGVVVGGQWSVVSGQWSVDSG